MYNHSLKDLDRWGGIRPYFVDFPNLFMYVRSHWVIGTREKLSSVNEYPQTDWRDGIIGSCSTQPAQTFYDHD